MKKSVFTLNPISFKNNILTFFLLISTMSWAQTGTQTIRGTIVDKQSEFPLIGAAVEVTTLENTKGSITDVDGRFVISDVPYGRQELNVSYLGYNSITLPNIVVSAGKEVILEIRLEESVVQMNEVVVTAEVEKDKANNEMATISTRSFSLEEVTRYSGGRNDVSRLASNFAGVSTANDSRNDIVIRGNSPTGVLWRLEGVPIPNPNHFSTLGTTGGPVSALNPNLLKNSDFMTSAFPAEYGNANAGVFDIGFRNGNKDRYEFTAQLAAFSGLEFMAEGPLSKKKKGSFLVSYRNSFVEIANVLGIPTGTTATPNYKDLSFKIDLGNGKAGKFSFFGIGGLSDITFLGEEIDETDLFADPTQDATAQSKLGIIGVKHNILLNKTTYVRTVISASTSQNGFNQDNLLEDGTKLRVTEVDDINDRYSLSSFLNKKFNAKFNLRTGVLIEYMNLKTRVDNRDGEPDNDGDGEPDWVKVRDFNGGMTLFQAYGQAQYRVNEKWTLNLGLHSQFLDFNNTYAIEPRAAINWNFQPNQSLSLGYGMHNQMQPLPVIFHEEETSPGVFERTNAELDFTQSQHFVLGYDLKFGTDWRVKAEAYYQDISDAAVESFPSSYSVLNSGADFVSPVEGSLVNNGVGTNYGFELTVEKFFSKGYYGLLTASIFESKYKGSDGIERNTAFNNNYVLNVLAGKEVKIGKDKRNALSFDFKLTTAGGRYFTPIDEDASKAAGEEVLIEELAYSEQYDPYFKLDVKFGFHLNSKKRKFSQQFFLDLQNITGHKNIFVNRYNKLTNEVNPVYQSGFFPDILYRVQF
jgi:CarboxypepD_reg-like domain/TonB-dependent Receptor Plug Domain